jgi:hypothetical protein
MELISSQSSTSSPATLNLEFWPRQREAFDTEATELLFGGASEGGKSVFIRLMLSALCSAVPNLQCFIYRKYYQDVIRNHQQGEMSFPDILRPWVQQKLVEITENEVRWTKTGSLITLGQLRTDEDVEKAQGVPKHVLVLDEATQIKERHIKDVRGWVRMSKEMKALLPVYLKPLYPWLSDAQLMEMLPRVLYTANPIGASVGFFRRTFVKSRAPRSIEKVGAFKQQYIPSRIDDNPSADKEAQRARLESMSGAAVADALITGNWDAPIGDYLREYNDELHSCPDCQPADHLYKWRSIDWGSADPAAVYWFFSSDGEPFKDQHGRVRWFPKGAVVVYREWYICDPNEQSKGARLSNEDIAKGINARTRETIQGPTLADRYPFVDQGHTRHGEKYTIATVFEDNGCKLTLANTARLFGWNELKARLMGRREMGPDGKEYTLPMIYFCESCRYAREYIPALETDPDDIEDAVDVGEATHSCDAIRYGVALKPIVKKMEPKQVPLQKGIRKLTPKEIIERQGETKQRRGLRR